GPVIEARTTRLGIEPCERVLHPILVVTVWVVLARMSAATLEPVDRTFNGNDRLRDEVVELEGFDEVRVPDHGTIGDADVTHACVNGIDGLLPISQRFAGAKYRGIRLHGFLHGKAHLCRRCPALRIAETIEARERVLAGILRQLGVFFARPERL